jgi:hypothetical protein
MRSGSARTTPGAGSRLEPDTGGIGDGAQQLDGLRHQVADLAVAPRHLHAAGLHALDVQDVVDQPDEPVGVRDGDVEHPLALIGDRPHRAAGEQAERAPDRRQRRAQLVRDDRHELVPEPLGLPSRGDVGEDDHGALHASALHDRRAGVLDREARAVLAPEDLIGDAQDLAVAERRVDRALLDGVRRAVGPVVVHERVHARADQLVAFVAGHRDRGGVHLYGVTVAVEAEDALAGGGEDPRGLPCQPAPPPVVGAHDRQHAAEQRDQHRHERTRR